MSRTLLTMAIAGSALALAIVVAASGRPSNAVGAAIADASASPGRLVRLPDGRVMNFRCTGSGGPTILLDGGFAATSVAWYKVQPPLAVGHRVCSYDRAGYGFSDPGPEPRDGSAVARDLDEALTAARIRGPFVVVGHSAGGLYVRLFANRRPRQVVGMVLVDLSVEFQDKRLQAAFGPGAGSLAAMRARSQRCLGAAEAGALPSDDNALRVCAPPATPRESAAAYAARLAQARRPATWRAQISELDNLWTRTSEEIAAGRSRYGAMPLIVLTADGTNANVPAPARPTADALWRGLHREVAARSVRGEERLVIGTSHMMIFDRPDAIVQAVAEVLARWKSGA